MHNQLQTSRPHSPSPDNLINLFSCSPLLNTRSSRIWVVLIQPNMYLFMKSSWLEMRCNFFTSLFGIKSTAAFWVSFSLLTSFGGPWISKYVFAPISVLLLRFWQSTSKFSESWSYKIPVFSSSFGFYSGMSYMDCKVFVLEILLETSIDFRRYFSPLGSGRFVLVLSTSVMASFSMIVSFKLSWNPVFHTLIIFSEPPVTK